MLFSLMNGGRGTLIKIFIEIKWMFSSFYVVITNIYILIKKDYIKNLIMIYLQTGKNTNKVSIIG